MQGAQEDSACAWACGCGCGCGCARTRAAWPRYGVHVAYTWRTDEGVLRQLHERAAGELTLRWLVPEALHERVRPRRVGWLRRVRPRVEVPKLLLTAETTDRVLAVSGGDRDEGGELIRL